MLATICEVLRMEQRATFHDGLLDLVISLSNTTESTAIAGTTTEFQPVANQIAELRAIIARANRLLGGEDGPEVSKVAVPVVTPTYQREIVLPRNRHDNNQLDITKIKILPAEEEIRSDHAELSPSTDFDQPHSSSPDSKHHRSHNAMPD
jgi:hypothetical protein